MQPLENVEQSTTTQIFAAHLSLIKTDIQAWADLLAEDAVVEFPYASALGLPERLEGKLAIYNHMKNAIAQMQNLTFTNIREYQTSNPDVLFAEVHGEAMIVATGRHYQQDYVMRLETKAGKIFHYREYWNPSAVVDAWSDSRQALNAQ
jgi:hypothetical protein